MKLNTLLLTSAATLMATSVAFAADLPSKKAAPAAGSVQVCKVGGMTGFTVPGGDTCLGVGGFMRFEAQYQLDDARDSDDGKLDWDYWNGEARIHFDARSNTEIGAVRGYYEITSEPTPSTRRAYVQFAGFTAGKKDSIADVMGTQSLELGLWGQGADGVDYQVNAGGLTFGIGAETPNSDNATTATADSGSVQGKTTTYTADNPDLIAHLSGKVGEVGFALAAVSHQAYDVVGGDDDGYAVLGNVNVTMSGVRLGVFGGMATNASAYTGNAGADTDFEGGADLDTDVYGGSIMFTQGKLSTWVEYARYSAQLGSAAEVDGNTLAVGASYTIAKNLGVTAEYATNSFDNAALDDDDRLYLRIQRDF